MGADLEKAAAGIEEFHGTHRRFEHKGFINGAEIIDDYAHHPTEIAATLKAVRSSGYNKVWCVFQPHTYTRTRTLWDEFVSAFDNVDELILVDIYAAREQYDGKTRSEDLARAIAERGVHTRYCRSFSEAEELLRKELKPGELLLTMGAGNVVEIGEDLCGEKHI